MADEIFDFELEGADGGILAPEPQLRPRAEVQADAIVLATPSTAQDDGPAPASGSGALASSVPISIPVQLSFRRWKDSDTGQVQELDSFVPPHTLSQQAALAESLPLSSSSRIRTRNKVFQSTGYLPTNCQQGFLVSRTTDRNAAPQPPSSNTSGLAQSAFAAAAARSSGGSARVVTGNTCLDAGDSGSEQSTPGASAAGRTRDFCRTATGLSIAAAIPERDVLEAPSL